MNIEQLTKYLIDICKKYNKNKIYICGNGGSGKTTLSKKIYEEASKYGLTNLISLDDFLVDTTLRTNSVNKWTENEIEYSGRYTSSNIESYFLKNVYEILYNIDNGIDCYYFPRKYKEKNNIRKLYSNYFLTIIEGVGTAFLEKSKDRSINIMLMCNKENEIKRRKQRTEKLKRENIELYDDLRSSQYRVNILPHKNDFHLIIESDTNYNYNIINNKIKM